MISATKSSVDDIRDPRLEDIESSLGHRMLKVASIIPANEFAAPEESNLRQLDS